MKVRLLPGAIAQLAALPATAGRRVVRSLRALAAAPRSGHRYPDDSEFRGLHYKLVVVRARRWTYRITYELRGDELVIFYLYPSWYPPTHPDLAGPPGDEP